LGSRRAKALVQKFKRLLRKLVQGVQGALKRWFKSFVQSY
jgi:hypothetical protein